MKYFKHTVFGDCAAAVLPITAIIIVVSLFLPEKLNAFGYTGFIFGNILLILGMTLYSLGTKISLEPIGVEFGSFITMKGKILPIVILGLVIGFIITVAEPDLSVLGEQLGDVKWIIILTIALGVGVFLALAMLKIIFKWDLSLVLLVLYAIVFLVALFTDYKYVPLCFDSGGVTTGALTVPFILAIGTSVAGAVGGKHKQENSFGLIAICSVGPILMMLLLCAVFRPEVSTAVSLNQSESFAEMLLLFGNIALSCFKEVLIALCPIAILFFIFNFAFFRLPKSTLFRILAGLLYTYIGLALFLTGVNAAYMGMGFFIGNALAKLQSNWVLIPVGAVVGCFIVLAEPAVGVLVKQVETISSGAIKKRTILIALALSNAFAIAFSMLRILTAISFWYIIGIGYIIALGLSFFVPKVYTAIAFDSGGVASGPMTATFLLPFAIGAASAADGADSVLTVAYGLVATVALMPLITIQITGLIAETKRKRMMTKIAVPAPCDDDIIILTENNVSTDDARGDLNKKSKNKRKKSVK